MAEAAKLESILNEYLSLFKFAIEEDIGYRKIEMFQNAGILPVRGGGGMGSENPNIGERPRGVSANIP